MQTNNEEMIPSISNRNTEMRCCQTLFSVNCWLPNWSKEVIGEIQFNLQLLYPPFRINSRLTNWSESCWWNRALVWWKQVENQNMDCILNFKLVIFHNNFLFPRFYSKLLSYFSKIFIKFHQNVLKTSAKKYF